MSVKGRPTSRECLKKIKAAQEKILQSDWAPAERTKLLANFEELDLWTSEEHTDALQTAIQEVKPEDYAGSYPPLRSYEEACKDAELFAFAWDSTQFSCRMYLKFCFVRGSLYMLSFHKDRPPKGGEEK